MANIEDDQSTLDARRQFALVSVRGAMKRIRRRITAIDGDLNRITNARQLAASAAWLIPAAARAKRGATVLEGVDWSTGEAVEIQVPLDPAKPARDQIETLFRKAKRSINGEAIASKRKEESEDAYRALAEIAAAIEFAESDLELENAMDRARAASPSDMPRRRTLQLAKKKGDEPLPPHRTFRSGAGLVFVGRGASRNDELTFQIAKPYHLWMHARGVPGAHVVVPLARNKSCPADLLIDASHLAAHFSDARGESMVEVSTAPRKWVRKPRGAAPGAVVVEREKVVTVRVEAERLQRLLASEVID